MGSDAELLAASGSEPEAFGELYDRHAETLLTFPYRRTADPHLAADLVAETFAEAYRSRSPTTCSGTGLCLPSWTSAPSEAKAGGGQYVQAHRHAFRSSPAVADGVVYVTSASGEVDAFDARTCEADHSCRPAWTQWMNGSFLTSPVVADGKLFVVGRTNLYAFAPGEADAQRTGWQATALDRRSRARAWRPAVPPREAFRETEIVGGRARVVVARLGLYVEPPGRSCDSSAVAASAVDRASAEGGRDRSISVHRGALRLEYGCLDRELGDDPHRRPRAGQPAFRPTVISGSPGEHLSVTVIQSDDLSAHYQHNVSIGSLGIDRDVPKGPGGTVTFGVTLPSSGPLVFFCKYHAIEFHAGEFQVG